MLLQDRRTSICQQEGRAASLHFQQATGRQAGGDGNHSKRGAMRFLQAHPRTPGGTTLAGEQGGRERNTRFSQRSPLPISNNDCCSPV